MHNFTGKWITDSEFYKLAPRNVFHRQLEKIDLPCDEHRNRHILFRKKFNLEKLPGKAVMFISADDYYKLYINGKFVAQGPSPSYHFQYNYNEIDVTAFLSEGENTIAVHTLYQGLINRVWVSGDNRHGLILDLDFDGKTFLSSDESFKTAPHSGYRETGICGYQTQCLEEYNSNAPEVGFEAPDFDDSKWENAKLHTCLDITLAEQKSYMLKFEKILPVSKELKGNTLSLDFGSNYVGYLCLEAKGKSGDVVTIRCGNDLNDDGSVRFALRANCTYEENWIISEGTSTLDWFDYKTFRHADVILPEGVEITNAFMSVRHYPFELKAKMKPEYAESEKLQNIWNLCVHTQKYGVQEVIQDCMEREKGFYVGDGCYTALTYMLLTKDDTMVRKLIDDAFSSSFITEGLVTCLDCAFMQEIAEYPLIMVYLILWHYRLTGDKEYLAANYPKTVKLLESYRKDYEKNGILSHLDKWCVVEWPKNFQDGYDVDITEGKICEQPHVSINAYYLEAIKTANKMAKILGLEPYREEKPLIDAFYNAFYDKEHHLFTDGTKTDHTSIIGNCFPYGFGLIPDPEFKANFEEMVNTRKISAFSFFCAFITMMGLVRAGKTEMLESALLDEGAWLRIIREGGTTTFEGWGKDTKWNTSLFHLTMSFAATFLSDTDLEKLFG